MELRSHCLTCTRVVVNDSDGSDEKEFERSVFHDKALLDASETKQKSSEQSAPTTNLAVQVVAPLLMKGLHP